MILFHPSSSLLAQHCYLTVLISRGQQQLAATNMRQPVPLGMAWAIHTDMITGPVSTWFYKPWNISTSPFVLHHYHFTSHHTAKALSDPDTYNPFGFPDPAGKIQNQAPDGICKSHSHTHGLGRGQLVPWAPLLYQNLNYRDWTGQANSLFQFCYLIKSLKLSSAGECSHIIHFPYPMLTKQ